jgi:hypothetical protein
MVFGGRKNQKTIGKNWVLEFKKTASNYDNHHTKATTFG